jgi:hypothetical protein
VKRLHYVLIHLYAIAALGLGFLGVGSLLAQAQWLREIAIILHGTQV